MYINKFLNKAGFKLINKKKKKKKKKKNRSEFS